jgi:hypothetical protein
MLLELKVKHWSQKLIKYYHTSKKKFWLPVHIEFKHYLSENHISGVMVSVLTSSVGERGFEPRLCPTKDYEIGICCLSA